MLQLAPKEGLLLSLIGVAIGLTASFGAPSLIASFLCGVKAHDPLTLVIVSLFLVNITVPGNLYFSAPGDGARPNGNAKARVIHGPCRPTTRDEKEAGTRVCRPGFSPGKTVRLSKTHITIWSREA